MRRAFTLIELMVALALTLFIMVILAEVFVAGLDAFSTLKGLGDLQQNLRTALTGLQFDLSQDHFEGGRRVSDPAIMTRPPREGFFVVYQNSAAVTAPSGAAYLKEGTDADGIDSFRAVDHVLHFTMKLRGTGQDRFFTTLVDVAPTAANVTKVLQPFFNACRSVGDVVTPYDGRDLTLNPYAYDFTVVPPTPAPPYLFRGQWAEVAYFLVQTGTTAEPSNPASTLGTPLYGLYRLQLVAPLGSSELNNADSGAGFTTSKPFLGMACDHATGSSKATFFAPADMAVDTTPRQRTFQPPQVTPRILQNPSTATQPSSLILANVVSFQVTVLTKTGGVFQDLPGSGPFPRTYDSAVLVTPASARYGIQALQVTLRAWDPRSQQARQATLVQPL